EANASDVHLHRFTSLRRTTISQRTQDGVPLSRELRTRRGVRKLQRSMHRSTRAEIVSGQPSSRLHRTCSLAQRAVRYGPFDRLHGAQSTAMKFVNSSNAKLRVEHTPRPGAPVLLLLHAL